MFDEPLFAGTRRAIEVIEIAPHINKSPVHGKKFPHRASLPRHRRLIPRSESHPKAPLKSRNRLISLILHRFPKTDKLGSEPGLLASWLSMTQSMVPKERSAAESCRQGPESQVSNHRHVCAQSMATDLKGRKTGVRQLVSHGLQNLGNHHANSPCPISLT